MKVGNRGTLSERLRRQIRNLLGFARAGSNPAGVVVFSSTFWLTYSEVVQWPSGLRRSTQVRVSSEAWVRTPPEPFFGLTSYVMKTIRKLNAFSLL